MNPQLNFNCKMDNLPNAIQIAELTSSVDVATNYLLNHDCINFPTVCERCGGNDTFSWKDTKMKMVRCKERGCRHQFSIYKDTFMKGSRLDARQILYLAKSWLNEETVKATAVNLKGLVGRNSIVNYFGYFRQLVLSDISEADEIIGSPGKLKI